MMIAFKRLRFAVSAFLVGLVLFTPIGFPAVSAEPVKQGGETGSRIVGVSCICYGPCANMKDMEDRIDRAALDKPDVILLTEGCMHNTPRTATKEEMDAKSEPLPEPGPITKFLGRKAKEHNVYIMGSYWRKDPKGRGRYNSAVLLDRQGKLVGFYDKVFPTIREMEGGVLPGASAKVFDTDFGRIGALICFDLNFHELLNEYKKQRVELLCFLSNFRGGLRVPAVAFKNQCFVASAVPSENGVIVDPLGRTLAESSQYGRIIFAKINLDSQIVHIDYHPEKVLAMKEKYGEQVTIETASPEAVYFLSSRHPDKSVRDMMDEFGIATLDEYLDRARAERQKYLPKE